MVEYVYPCTFLTQRASPTFSSRSGRRISGIRLLHPLISIGPRMSQRLHGPHRPGIWHFCLWFSLSVIFGLKYSNWYQSICVGTTCQTKLRSCLNHISHQAIFFCNSCRICIMFNYVIIEWPLIEMLEYCHPRTLPNFNIKPPRLAVAKVGAESTRNHSILERLELHFRSFFESVDLQICLQNCLVKWLNGYLPAKNIHFEFLDLQFFLKVCLKSAYRDV